MSEARLPDERLPDDQPPDERLPDEQLPDEQLPDERRSEAGPPEPAAGDVGFREVRVDLDAITSNVGVLRELIGTEHFIAVVKANAYGHGTRSARAALDGGADWLGVATIAEALELREAGITAPVLAWLHAPDEGFDSAVEADVSLGVSSVAQLHSIARAARLRRRPASVQLKLDTGLSRNGLPREVWPEAFGVAADLERAGRLEVVGVFTHLSNATIEDDSAALARFDEGVALVRSAGLDPGLVHAAASAAALRQPEARYNTVRVGLAIYGLSPFQDTAGARALGLRPAMTVRGRVANVKRVPAGAGVSYDYTYRTERETTLALVPFGYGDGVPRAASNLAPVWIGGKVYTVSGRIAMDQFVVDVGDAPVQVGDPVVLFGDAGAGFPAVEEWARAAGTINWEIVTRIGGRAAGVWVSRSSVE